MQRRARLERGVGSAIVLFAALGSAGAVDVDEYAITDLGTFGATTDPYVSGINVPGQVSVYSSEGSCFKAFVWKFGQATALPALPGAGHTFAYDLNLYGEVVGSCHVYGGFEAVLWSGGTAHALTEPLSIADARAINDSGDIAGYLKYGLGPYVAVAWIAGDMIDLPSLGGPNSEVYGINSLGQIVGCAETPDGQWHPCLWVGDQVIDLGLLGGTGGCAFAVNDAAQVVGVAGAPFL